MSFRCAARVPDRSGLGAACPAVVRRLRYLCRAIICFHVPNSRIRSFHIRQPWLAVSYCVPTMKSFSSSDFMRRNRKLENRYDKVCNRLSDMPERRRAEVAGMSELAADAARESPEARCGPNRSEESAFFGCGARCTVFFGKNGNRCESERLTKTGGSCRNNKKRDAARPAFLFVVLRPVANSS